MSYADGIRLGMSVINDSKAAKIKEEELKAWREDREDKKGRNKLIDTSMEDTLASLSSPKSDTVSPFLTQQGLMPMSTYYEGEQGAYNRRQGFGAAPDLPTQAEPLNLPKRDNTLAMGQLKALQAARDSSGFFTAANADKQAQLAHDAAQIQSYVTNKATPEQIKAFSDKYTGDARIPGKMKFDKATGMTTIDLDSGESVQLNKQQFGSYLAGMYRQEQGDPTAGASITAIHEALGKQADAIYNRQTGAVKVNNDVAKEGADQKHRSQMLGIQAGQETRARELHKIAMEDSKIPAAVKLQATSLAKQMENIGTSLNKAMAEGQFDPNNAGTKSLLEKQADLGIQYERLLAGYIPKGKDQPTGLPDASAFAAQPAPAATAQQPARPTAPPAPGMQMGDYLNSIGRSLSGNSQAQIGSIKNKLQQGLPLSGVEQVIARENNLISTR